MNTQRDEYGFSEKVKWEWIESAGGDINCYGENMLVCLDFLRKGYITYLDINMREQLRLNTVLGLV